MRSRGPVFAVVFSAAMAGLAAGCAPAPYSVLGITPYRMEIQQGNYVSRDMVQRLRLGMSKEQVRFVLGTPLIADLYHSDRWDYVYYRDDAGKPQEHAKIAVYFKNDKLVKVEGDALPAVGEDGSAGS